MIISHKYKFIFIKAQKVAGTSIEIALAKHCGNEDIITPITKYSEASDSSLYIHPVKNYENGYYNHITPEEIKDKIGNDIWNKYFKFSVVRNPWDLQISWLYWQLKDRPPKNKIVNYYIYVIKRNFANPRYYFRFLKKIWHKASKKKTASTSDKSINLLGETIIILDNSKYYFDSSGKPVCDFCIKYENLEEDYHKICCKLGIPYEKLPLTKNKLRKDSKHYSKYYDNKTKLIIEKRFKKQVEYYNYKFEAIKKD